MNKLFSASLLLAVVIAACLLSSTSASPSLFNAFQKKFNKFYDVDEYQQRYQIFMQNLNTINNLNQQQQHATSSSDDNNAENGAVFGVTEFSDLTAAEFKKKYLLEDGALAGMVEQMQRETDMRSEYGRTYNTRATIPTAYDWRNYNRSVLTPVKQQGACGSCWAHSTIESIESQWAISGKALVSLSKQQLLDCDPNESGCNGGWPTRAYTYVLGAGGVQSAAAYPYTAVKGTCLFDKSQIVAKITGYTTITTTNDEAAMANFVATKGPLSVCLDATVWQHYTGGVLTPSSGCGTTLNHCVMVTGYNVTAAGVPVWNVRNSWGPNWGESGYIRLQRGVNLCRIAASPTAATV